MEQFNGQTGEQYSEYEARIRHAARLAHELASSAPEFTYPTIWRDVFSTAMWGAAQPIDLPAQQESATAN